MENKNEDFSNVPKISSRLVLKNIPCSLSDNQILEIFKKNFDENIGETALIFKLEKKYATKNRNKICFFTANNLETRAKIFDFFSTFDLVDPNGIKQKLTVNDCLLQNKIKGEKDTIENTIESCDHFKKFKEYLSKEKLVEFKSEEEKCNLTFLIPFSSLR